MSPVRAALSLSLLVAAVLLVSCGPVDGGTAPTPGAEAANGEAPATTYVDSRYHYKVDAPGRMSANGDGTASVIGPSERLEVSVIQGSNAANPLPLARDEA